MIREIREKIEKEKHKENLIVEKLEELQRLLDDTRIEIKGLEAASWHGVEEGNVCYCVVVTMSGGARVEKCYTAINERFEGGFAFATSKEAEHVANMLNYFGLLARKARQMNGLIGYTYDVYDAYDDDTNTCTLWYDEDSERLSYISYVEDVIKCPPLQPLLTVECAKSARFF